MQGLERGRRVEEPKFDGWWLQRVSEREGSGRPPVVLEYDGWLYSPSICWIEPWGAGRGVKLSGWGLDMVHWGHPGHARSADLRCCRVTWAWGPCTHQRLGESQCPEKEQCPAGGWPNLPRALKTPKGKNLWTQKLTFPQEIPARKITLIHVWG